MNVSDLSKPDLTKFQNAMRGRKFRAARRAQEAESSCGRYLKVPYFYTF